MCCDRSTPVRARVLERLQAFEERHGSQYDAVVWTRFEMHWLAPHPPLSALPIQSCLWTPIGEDYAGLNDRHAIFRRDLAPIYLGRWDALTLTLSSTPVNLTQPLTYP